MPGELDVAAVMGNCCEKEQTLLGYSDGKGIPGGLSLWRLTIYVLAEAVETHAPHFLQFVTMVHRLKTVFTESTDAGRLQKDLDNLEKEMKNVCKGQKLKIHPHQEAHNPPNGGKGMNKI